MSADSTTSVMTVPVMKRPKTGWFSRRMPFEPVILKIDAVGGAKRCRS